MRVFSMWEECESLVLRGQPITSFLKMAYDDPTLMEFTNLSSLIYIES